MDRLMNGSLYNDRDAVISVLAVEQVRSEVYNAKIDDNAYNYKDCCEKYGTKMVGDYRFGFIY